MKTSINTFLTAMFLLLAFPGMAQDVVDCKTIRDGIVMKDGKMMIIGKDGILLPMEEDAELANGTKVMKNGDYKLVSGTKLKMRNGEVFTKKGDLMILSDQVTKVEGAVVKEGKVWQIKEGNLSAVESETELASGDKISPDGTITFKSGAKLTLKEGEVLTAAGEIVRRKDDMMTMEGVLMRNGKMMKWENNKLVALDKETTLSNGTKVATDGNTTLKDGSKIALKDGDMLNLKNEISIAKTDMLTEGVLMRDGKMMVLEQGKISSLDKEITFTNGSVIMTTGMLMSSDGNKIALKDGDFISMKGDLMILKGSKMDANAVTGRTVAADHLIFTGGRMMLVKNGEPQALITEMTMPNGSKVLKHGQVHKKDGTKITLKEGEKVTMNGDILVDQGKADYNEKNHLVMKMGKMMAVKNGKETPMTSEVLLSDWSKVLVDGTVAKNEGTSYKLKEGERINMDGETMPKINTGYVATTTKGTTLSNSTTASTTTTATTTQNCYTMKGGKMVILLGDKELPMTKEKSFGNGSKLMPDGSWIKKDGSKSMVKEGERIDMLTGEMIKK